MRTQLIGGISKVGCLIPLRPGGGKARKYLMDGMNPMRWRSFFVTSTLFVIATGTNGYKVAFHSQKVLVKVVEIHFHVILIVWSHSKHVPFSSITGTLGQKKD